MGFLHLEPALKKKQKTKKNPTRAKPEQLVALENFAAVCTRNLAFLLTAEVLNTIFYEKEVLSGLGLVMDSADKPRHH